MVEVFKTNVNEVSQAKDLIASLLKQYRAICAIIKLISEVRNAPFFLSYWKIIHNEAACKQKISIRKVSR